MTKSTRILSMLIAFVILMSAFTGVCVTSAENDSAAKFIFNPITKASVSGYGQDVRISGLFIVCGAWSSAKDGSKVIAYYDTDKDGQDEAYRFIKGQNAFATIGDAIAAAGENTTIKVGPGTYTENFTFAYSGLSIYGNYAGVDPNVDIASDNYVVPLNPVRKPALETVLKNCHIDWPTKIYSTVFDGFKVTEMDSTHFLAIVVSGGTHYYQQFTNNIFDGTASSGYVFSANAGTSVGVHIENNRFLNCVNSYILYFGGSKSDIVMDKNYFENCTATLYGSTMCAGYTGEALLSFSYNRVYNCATPINFVYNSTGGTIWYDYKRIVGNIFYGCTGTSIINASYWYERINGTSLVKRLTLSSKTLISDNTFYLSGSGKYAMAMDSKGLYTHVPGEGSYNISFINNKLLYPSNSTANRAAKTTNNDGTASEKQQIFTVDASHNFYGYLNGDTYVSHPTDNLYDTYATTLITSPYYNNKEMTELSGGVALEVYNANMLEACGFKKNSVSEPENFTVDNENFAVKAVAKDGADIVSFDYLYDNVNYDILRSATGAKLTFTYYSDFMMENVIDDKDVDITGEKTLAYLIVSDEEGNSSRYDVSIKTKIDKTKAEVKNIFDVEENKKIATADTTSKIAVATVDTSRVFMPFELIVSPGATYTLYTDKDCKNVYADDTYYIKPDDINIFYAKVTSADGSNSNVYKIGITRPGSNEYDARIMEIVTPEANIMLNNDRRTISYRPAGLTESAVFDFTVSKDSFYEIYTNYDETTGKLSGLVSSKANPTAVPIGDAINYYYVNVNNNNGYHQVYKITAYNDVKSTDNVITGITGMTSGIEIKDNVIRITASSTLTAINAHFEVNPFAKVTVYADKEKTFEVPAAITYSTVNNREAEVRTFQLGVDGRISYFYVDVVSETGELNSYQVIIKNDKAAVPFTDTAEHWAKDYIARVSGLGVVTGYLDALTNTYTFRPNNNATRQEVAAMFCRVMGISSIAFKNESLTGVFADANSVPDWSYNYVKAVYFLNIMVGSANAEGKIEFKPTDKMTRQEFFQAIANVMNLDMHGAADVDLGKFKDGATVPSWAVAATKAVVKAGIIEGADGYLNPKSNITRAEITTILDRVNTISEELSK